MAIEVYQFAVTIPAGTANTSPYSANLTLPLFDIESIDLEVPPGPSGLMGFYLALSGQQWIPHSTGQWIVWDNTKVNWPLSEQPTSYGWQLYGYNTDVYPHTVTVRFHVNLVPDVQQPTPPTVNIIATPTPQPVSVL